MSCHFTYVTALIILQAFSHFIYVTTHSDFSKLSFTSPTSQQSSFSKLSITSPTSQLILISPSFPSLHLHQSSFSNPSLALPTSQLILQPFCCFTYIIAHSPTLLSLLLHHRIFTYVTWRAAHELEIFKVVGSKTPGRL